MAYLFIGAGQAGGALVDSVFKYKNMHLLAKPLAINSTAKDLINLKNIDKKDWIGISENSGLIKGTTIGFEERVAGGFGKNPIKAGEAIQSYYKELKEILQNRMQDGIKQKTPFVFIFLGLGGGTGSGISPFIAKAIKYISNKVKIIAVVVLPAHRKKNIASKNKKDLDKDESGDRQSWNAFYTLNRLKKYVDSFILVDNHRLAYLANLESYFPRYNDYIAASIVDLVAGVLLEKIDPSKYNIGMPVIDINDIITATSFDIKGEKVEPGYAVLGRASELTKSLAGYFFPFFGYKKIDTLMLLQVAIEKLSVADFSIGACEKNLALLRVPAFYLKHSKKGADLKSIEQAMLQYSKMNESHIGVSLTKRNIASLTILYTFKFEDLKRLRMIEELAHDFEERQ